MEEMFPTRENSTRSSTNKTMRTMLLAILLQVTWPARLSKQQLFQQLPFYGDSPEKALKRDLHILTECPFKELRAPGSADLDEWCVQQKGRQKLAITFDHHDNTFGLARSLITIDINDDEARAFVALENGFSLGTPYAEAVQHLLKRWEWLFSEKSRELIETKRKRKSRPVLLPLSPAVDYSQHTKVILGLDKALEDNEYISFDYTPLSRNESDPPEQYKRIEPYELEYRDGHWYFSAYIFDLGTFRDFRADRIRSDTFHREDRFYPGLRRRRGEKIQYWVSPSMARHGTVSTRLQDQHVTILEQDKGAIVEGYARSLWWAKRLLQGYGEQVKALAPKALVEQMRDAALATSRLYEE